MTIPAITLNEIAFHQSYGSLLAKAESFTKKFQISKNEIDLDQAWNIYYRISSECDAKMKEMEYLELKNVSPSLLNMKNLQIVMPGFYHPGSSKDSLCYITGFNPVLSLFPSKQHPRKLTMIGSDQKNYLFLLKGHEDNRQDERVMQFFGLINTLLSTDHQTQKKNLSIRRYPVIPLSPNAGLIGWVPNCDTLHALIKEYRNSYKINPSIEYELIKSMCGNFEIACIINKVEVFRHVMDNTYGQDLYKILWLKSKNSEVWFERRTNYTRSHAVMCMAGYILGLGDRHPSNLMLDRYSGKIVHIDFGDCFESAMRRERCPEKVPFRLTRMMVRAMEVSGIEGTFRITCEQTMKVLRENKDSLLAILEAFVYDPLISFRLLTGDILREGKKMEKIAKGNEQNFTANANFRPSMAIGKIQDEDETALKNKAAFKDQRKKIGLGVIDAANKEEEKEAPANNNQGVLQEGYNILMSLSVDDAAAEASSIDQEKLNQTAQFVMNRIKGKLNGEEFGKKFIYDVQRQVDKLIKQATSDENLAQCYIGWCPYW